MTDHENERYPVLIMRCYEDHTEVEDVDLGTAGSLDEAKAMTSEEGYLVMTGEDDEYADYGACETKDTVTGDYRHIVTIADESLALNER